MTRLIITVIDEDGEHSVHQTGGVAGYSTLCGISTDDDQHEQTLSEPGDKINCAACYQIWLSAVDLKNSDFTKEAKTTE